MRRHLLSLAVTLALSNSLHAQIVAESRISGEKFAVNVPDKVIKDTPKWGKAADNPPLSARGAIELATAMVKQLLPDKDGAKWEFESMRLQRYAGDYWYWEAMFIESTGAPGAGQPASLRLFVLMDLTVPRPTVTKLKD